MLKINNYVVNNIHGKKPFKQIPNKNNFIAFIKYRNNRNSN